MEIRFARYEDRLDGGASKLDARLVLAGELVDRKHFADDKRGRTGLRAWADSEGVDVRRVSGFGS